MGSFDVKNKIDNNSCDAAFFANFKIKQIKTFFTPKIFCIFILPDPETVKKVQIRNTAWFQFSFQLVIMS